MINDVNPVSLPASYGYRLINSHFPPIAIFDEVADASEFDALYRLQERSNPRIRAEVGNLALLDRAEIPFGIPGCSYATAPFVHLNTNGSRFSKGDFGVLYVAENKETAIKEVHHHQALYWPNVTGIKDDVLVMRGLKCSFGPGLAYDVKAQGINHPIHDPVDYSTARAFGAEAYVKRKETPIIQYGSVRNPPYTCWALLSPALVTSVIQTFHCQFMLKSGVLVADVQYLRAAL